MRLLLLLIVSLMAAAVGALDYPNSMQMDAVDSNTSTARVPGPYSYQVSIEESLSLKRYVYWCTGAVVSRRIVLTSAHCLFQIDHFRLRVHVGVSGQESDRGQRYRIKEVKMHWQYTFGSPYFNVGFVRVARPIDPHVVEPIELFRPLNDYFRVNRTALVTGWGIIGGEYRNTLYATNVSVSTSDRCNNSLIDNPKQIVCHGDDFGKEYEAVDNCFGDPGALVTVDGQLLGFIAYTSCNLDLIPMGIYYEMHHFLDWLHEMLLDFN